MTYSRTLRICNGCKYGLDCGVPSVRGVDWRFAIGVDVGLNRPVLEVGALPVVFKVRSMVEDSQAVQGHGCREGLSGSCFARTARSSRFDNLQRGNIIPGLRK
jgi:hypothetical protein